MRDLPAGADLSGQPGSSVFSATRSRPGTSAGMAGCLAATGGVIAARQIHAIATGEAAGGGHLIT